MWFLFALTTTIAWGAADLFYKRGADENDRYTHLKTAIFVGLIMGLHAIVVLLTVDIHYDFRNMLIYLPVSLLYIGSMVIGYLGLRYLALSISSPIQNSSGAVTALLCLLILHQTLNTVNAIGVVLVCAGVLLLGIYESRTEDVLNPDNARYRRGLKAFFIPVLYCIIDALGTFFDAYYLDDFTSTPLVNVTEETFESVANISYELTFLLAAILLILFLKWKKQSIFNHFAKDRTAAAILETAGQFTYVYAMSGNGVVAAPIISSYCIVSLLFSRLFLKEKLVSWQKAAVCIVVAGIVIMGIAEEVSA